MEQYEDLSRKLQKAIVNNDMENSYNQIIQNGTTESKLIHALLHPDHEPLVIKNKDCTCHGAQHCACEAACLFDAIKRDEHNNIVITANCTGCGACIQACPEHNLVGRKDSVAVLNLLRDTKTPVYAMVAPAFCGQFGPDVTAGKLRTALKHLGFYGMVEVALFADILTLKEALEFDRAIKNEQDFVLTSCCCPLWIAMIRKSYKTMIPHVPPSVSPMVACGRSIKKLHANVKTVFIGPCLAKKAEAREPDISDAVDYVLTFEEIAELFELFHINPEQFTKQESNHASKAGRIYARTSGVSEAVQLTLARLRPDKDIALTAVQADGIPNCRKLLTELASGNVKANFIEGMGCQGGCVGGPKALVDKDTARKAVNSYGDTTNYKTPADNPYVIDLLHRLGYDTVESLLDRDCNFTRIFPD